MAGAVEVKSGIAACTSTRGGCPHPEDRKGIKVNYSGMESGSRWQALYTLNRRVGLCF